MKREMTADEKFMRVAMKEADKAELKDEVPVGCVIVRDGAVIARGHNRRETLQQAAEHAEIAAIRKACKAVGSWRLTDCELFVTLEPCVMCAGAIVNARVKRVVFGATDKRFGACGTLYRITEDERLNHRAETVGGVLGEECAAKLTRYFQAKRIAQRNPAKAE